MIWSIAHPSVLLSRLPLLVLASSLIVLGWLTNVNNSRGTSGSPDHSRHLPHLSITSASSPATHTTQTQKSSRLHLFNGELYQFFDRDQRQLKTIFSYLEGLQDGWQEFYYRSGNLHAEMHFREGVPDGRAIDYFDTEWSLRRAVTHYDNGVLNGEGIFFHEDGMRQRMKFIYRDGRYICQIHYSPDGIELSNTCPP